MWYQVLKPVTEVISKVCNQDVIFALIPFICVPDHLPFQEEKGHCLVLIWLQVEVRRLDLKGNLRWTHDTTLAIQDVWSPSGSFIQILISKAFHLGFIGKEKKGQEKNRNPRQVSKSNSVHTRTHGTNPCGPMWKNDCFQEWSKGKGLGSWAEGGSGVSGSPTSTFCFAFL